MVTGFTLTVLLSSRLVEIPVASERCSITEKTMTDTIVRIAAPEDARAIQGIYAPIVEQTPISFEDVTPTVQEMQDRIGTTLKNYPLIW